MERVLGIRSVPDELADRHGPRAVRRLRPDEEPGGAVPGQTIIPTIEVQQSERITDDPIIREMAGDKLHDQLSEDLELLDVAGDPFDLREGSARRADAAVFRQRDQQLRRADVPREFPAACARADAAPSSTDGPWNRRARSSRVTFSKSRPT